MGVTVVHVHPDKSRQGFKEVERLGHRIANLFGAQLSGRFHVDCDTFYVTPPPGQQCTHKLHIIHNNENPYTTYAILDTGTKQVTLSADALFDHLLPRLGNILQVKKNLRFDWAGNRFEIGDFIVKIGQVMMMSQYKGILVEVEYLPCVLPTLCWPLLREFMQSFLGHNMSNEMPAYLQNILNNIYRPHDTVQQYLEKFSELRDNACVAQVVDPSSVSPVDQPMASS